jgi:vancomycin permeability regulator SanA
MNPPPPTTAGSSRQKLGFAAARGFAAFLGGFSFLNVIGSLRHPAFDASHWWIGFPGLPAVLGQALLIAGSFLLLAFAARPAMSPGRRKATAGWIGGMLLMSLVNAAVFFTLLRRGVIEAGVPVPLSLLVAGGLAFVLWHTIRPTQPRALRNWPGIGATVAVCVIAFPLSQMVFFGQTDYRRPADAAVVFGARAYADGRPSTALADRVRTACQLYLDGTVAKLIFSGGPGDGDIHETESMRRMALALGVPDADILLDLHGLNTEATVLNTLPLFQEHEWDRVLAVSHAFHLPRIKMTFQRQGFQVFTVPAQESYVLRQMPFLMVRETAAWWVYYLRPLGGG